MEGEKVSPRRKLRDLELAQRLLIDSGFLTCEERLDIETAFENQRREMQQGLSSQEIEGEGE